MKSILILAILFLSPLTVLAEQQISIPSMTSINSSLMAILMVILAYVGKLISSFIHRKIKEIDNDSLQKIAYIAVRFVEDAFKKSAGSEKFKIACESVKRKLPKVSDENVGISVRAMYTNFASENQIKE